ncbi:MAG: CoA transferase [Dehalococcoidia bacterium]|nr:CoA transferase [Dehalococcoidia bacterium]
MAGALDGVRVIDLGRFIAIPFCGMLLADLGAEVIRIEKPGGTEDRTMGFLTPAGASYSFANQNRNKKGVTLNFERSEKGKQILYELVKLSDVVIHNFSPEAARGLGITYEIFKAVKPDIIFAQASAFGHTGPYQHRIGFDQIAKAMSGAMAVSGFPEHPTKEQSPHIDYLTATFTALGVVAALHHRQKTGEGQQIDTALLQTGITYMAPFLGEWEVGKMRRKRMGNRGQFVGPSDLYKAKDGRWVMLALITNSIWRRFARHIGRDDLANDPRYKDDYARWQNREVVDKAVADWVAANTSAEIIAEAEKIPIPAGICYEQTEVAGDPQVKAGEMLTQVQMPGVHGTMPVTSPPLKMSATPTKIVRSFPAVGEHNEEVYGKILGYSVERIEELKKEGLI